MTGLPSSSPAASRSRAAASHWSSSAVFRIKPLGNGTFGRRTACAFGALRPMVLTVPFEADTAADPAVLAAAAQAAGLDAEPCLDLEQALMTALSADGPAPRIVICGSLYLAGEVLAADPATWPG